MRASAVLLAALALVACDGRPKGGEAPAHSATTDPNEAAGVRFMEKLTGGASADEALPMIIGVHGLGGSPENFQYILGDLRVRARVVLPYGTEPFHGGFSWFPADARETPEKFAAGTERAAGRLAAMIAELVRRKSTVGKPIITGFSQGGMLSYTVAVLHPEAVRAAFPLGGLMASPLIPASWPAARDKPIIHAFHGGADERVPTDGDRSTVKRLVDLGLPVTLSVYPGVGHTVPDEMRRELREAIEAALKN
jgi:phospholipase/carboxylesterase